MTKELFLDTETYCEVPINNGTHVYAESAEVMIVTYALDDQQAKAWDLTAGEMMPEELLDALFDEDITIVIHNAGFDRTVIRHALKLDLDINRVFCTMACAMAHGLPGGLGILCDILGVPTDKVKDKKGKDLINLFCKPRPKTTKVRRYTRETHPKEWAEFILYALKDIDAVRAVHRRLPRWNYRDRELDLWRLDQRINDRGVAVDEALARSAVEAVGKAQYQLAGRTSEITGGIVSSATKRDALLGFILAEYNVFLPDMQMSTLERRINDDSLPVELRELLAIRLQATTTSTSKYAKLLGAVSPDGRLRGLLQFCGAQRTGRWAGRTFQPQNLPRPVLKSSDIEFGIRALKNGTADLCYTNIMELISSAIRGCIIAPKGKKLVVSDLSNIEGRVAAWLAGEAWKLDAFRLYDEVIGKDAKGKPLRAGPDLYKLAYAKAFKILVDAVTDSQRQVGKVMELFMQYEGGVGAFITGALAYGIDLDAMAAVALAEIPDDVLDEAAGAYEWALEKDRTFGLSAETYIVCDSLKRMWRRAHPQIASYWKELKEVVEAAINNPGKKFTSRKLIIQRDGAWLRIRLPSGRCLCYAQPMIKDGKIGYMGINQYTRQWSPTWSYGGKFFENICQAVARDVMAENMPYIERDGYLIVLSVHDELLTEAPDNDNFTSAELNALLSLVPEWGEGMPLAAGGFEAYRYKKE